MGIIRKILPVKLICAFLFKDEKNADKIQKVMENQYGPIDFKSNSFPFAFSDYYKPEMGPLLFKQFVSFANLLDPCQLSLIKVITNDIEDAEAQQQKRLINIDPGYLELSKLVLASTKNFSHRVYIGNGIYGDIQLVWRHGKFQENPWTYPDYKQPLAHNFFTQVRNDLHKKILEIKE